MTVQKSQELRVKRAELFEQAKEVLRLAESENRSLNGEEEANWQKWNDEIDDLGTRIERIEREAELDAEMRDAIDEKRAEAKEAGDETRFDEDEAFDRYMRFGKGGLNREERAHFSRKTSEAGWKPEETRAQAAGTDSAGGYVVPEGFAGFVTEAKLAFGGMRQARTTKLVTASGQDLPFPTNDDTGNVGALLAENTQVAEQDLTFGEVILEAYKYTSKLVRVSEELLQDNEVNVASFIGKKLGERLGRIHNTHFTTGTGTGQPRGLFTALTTGKTAASASVFTYDEILDLIYSVDESYLNGAQFMFRRAVELAARKLKDGNGQYLWQAGMQAGTPNTLDGYPIVGNPDAPAIATGADVMAFGDLSYYYIRDVKGVQLKIFNERYGDYLQRGFLAWDRADGDWIDAGGGAAKVLTMG